MNAFPASITSIWRASSEGNYAANPAEATSLLFHSRVTFNESRTYTVKLLGQTQAARPVLEKVKILSVRDKLFGDGDLPMSAVRSQMIAGELIITTNLSEAHPRIEVDFQFFAVYDKFLDQIATSAPEGSQPFSLEFVMEESEVQTKEVEVSKPEANAAFLRNECSGLGCYYGTRM